MKAKTFFLTAIVFCAMQAALADSTNLTSTATEPKPRLQPVYPPLDYNVALKKPGLEVADVNKIARYGQTSSQPWTVIATRQENPTLAHDVSTHESKLVLLSFSFGGKSPSHLKVGK
jgi:hypothetical protein